MSGPVATWELHSRLAADTHPVARWPLCDVLLMDDARFPWLILVPRVPGASEVFDLSDVDQVQLAIETRRAARLLQVDCRPDKLNIAALGNVVRQLHVHVVARFESDEAWPAPVWGHGSPLRYTDSALVERLARFSAACVDDAGLLLRRPTCSG